MKEKLYLLFFGLCITFGSYAQTIIKGTITDETGKPFPGVTVLVKATSQRVVTSEKGTYSVSLAAAKTAVLTFNYIGYLSQEVPVMDKTVINIKLVPNVSSLDEVVVTALGISRESRSLGYARQGVNVNEMTEARDPNIINMLEGKVAGMQLTTSGQATGSTRIVLRGVNSLSGSNEPLWVVDGIPIDNSSGQTGSIGNLDYGNGASFLNPDDIESIEVLKGPNAAALYGSNASNGAILVITKKGKASKGVGVSFNSNVMVNTISELPEYQNVYGEGGGGKMFNTSRVDWNLGVMKMGYTDRSWGAPMLGQPYANYAGVIGTYSPHPENITDLYRSSITTAQNISLDAADQNSSVRFSYTFKNGNDVMEKQNIVNSHNYALNASRTFKKKLKIDARLQYADERVENRIFRNMDANSPMNAYIYMMRSFDPANLKPWKDQNGNSFNYTQTGGYENPYWSINENYNEDRKSRVVGGVTALLTLTKDLKFRAQIAADLAFNKGFIFIDKGGSKMLTGQYRDFTENFQNWNNEGLLMYNKKLKDFTISANLGGNLRTRNNYRTTAQINTLAVHDVMNISNALGTSLNTDEPVRSQVNSVFATATFGYNNYLFLDLTGRNDWSSTLPANNRSYFYPSVSASFVFSDFFKIPKNILSFGKVRASVARVGKDANPYNLLSAFNYQGNFNGYTITAFDDLLKEANLKPEQTTSTEVGLNLKFFKGDIDFDATAYRSSSKDQIFIAQIARETGFNTRILNAGEIQNKGLEVSVTGKAINRKDFSWTVNANWSINRNLVVSLAPGYPQFQLGSWSSSLAINAEVGKPIGVIRGNDMYKDSNGNVIVNSTNGRSYSDPFQEEGNFLPDWLGSFGSTFRYKRFDLNFNVGIKIGGDLFSATNTKAANAGTTISSMEGRDAYYFSNVILGESGSELNGRTQLNNLPYPDANRSKGLLTEGYFPKLDANGNIMYDANGRMIAGAPNTFYIDPFNYWNYLEQMSHLSIFDASYIKLNQVILGYTFTSKFLAKTVFQSARISLVGRNLWTMYKNTPRGIDPGAANSSGNAQGIEQGGSLPYATYGLDIKFTF